MMFVGEEIKRVARAFEAERGQIPSPTLPVDIVESRFQTVSPRSLSPLDKRECRHRTFLWARMSLAVAARFQFIRDLSSGIAKRRGKARRCI